MGLGPRQLLRLERATALARAVSVTGVKLAASTWRFRAPLPWDGPPPAHRRPLVIVGGYAGHVEYYSLLRRSFEEAGFLRVTVMPPVDHSFGDIRESARQLASIVRLLEAPVDLVGHSQGGLVARWYASQLGGAECVRHIVTIGTPNLGLPSQVEHLPLLERIAAARRLNEAFDLVTTRLVAPDDTRALHQMLRGSEFMETLGQDPTPLPTRYLSIASRHDGVIPWSAGHLLPAENVANVTVDDGVVQGNHASIAATNATAFRAAVAFVRRD